ncbi:hypothetical protein WJT86_06425 [Microvirga sp. W0021]|uniref:Uncharacterized protein n=1 Tax=Hohaiivirga grylli TaxID=3133970 RepID=A0ABV0BIB5_9HYPH
MSWKQNLQLRDLEPRQKIEFTCRSCGKVHFRTAEQLLTDEDRQYLYLDELESKETCNQRGCHGEVRLMLLGIARMGGFTGGMA